MATFLEVRTMAFQRANLEYDTGVADEDRFVTEVEINRLINLAYRELYGHLVRHGMHRTETVYEITADGSDTYALPADLFAILTVHRVEDDFAILLTRHDHRLRPVASSGADASTYRVVGSTIEFNPVPDTGDYEVRYVPVPATLTADADTVDGVLGWEEYVVLYVAAKLLQKEGSFNAAAALQADARELLLRIRDEANAAELTEGTVVQNVRTVSTPVPGDFMSGGRPGLFWW